jgi:hypothetical protein
MPANAKQILDAPDVSPPSASVPSDKPTSPGELMHVCANCGSDMDERKCKLICHGCGYFLSCSDYY